MKVLCKSTAFLFLAFFIANAQDNTKTAVYVHPVALLFGANAKGLIFYSTLEIPLNLYFAPIIKPSVWKGAGVFRAGGDFGLRHYLAGRGDGLYLQPQVGAFYFSAKGWSGASYDFDDYDGFDNEYKYKNGTWFDGMLYLGNAYKFRYINIYTDSGIGYGCALGICSLIYDANIGVGISF